MPDISKNGPTQAKLECHTLQKNQLAFRKRIKTQELNLKSQEKHLFDTAAKPHRL